MLSVILSIKSLKISDILHILKILKQFSNHNGISYVLLVNIFNHASIILVKNHLQYYRIKVYDKKSYIDEKSYTDEKKIIYMQMKK